MNAWGLLLVWTALQVSVFCLVAIGVYALSRAGGAWSRAEWGWPAWVAMAILAGCALMLGRIVVALWVARRFRCSAREVADPAILESLASLCAEVGCPRAIELRETSATGPCGLTDR